MIGLKDRCLNTCKVIHCMLQISLTTASCRANNLNALFTSIFFKDYVVGLA